MKISIGRNALILATVLAASLVGTHNAGAQGTRSDYERALNLKKTTANKVFKSRVAAHWLGDNAQFTRDVSLFSSMQKPVCGERRLTISVLRQSFPKLPEKKYRQIGFQLIISDSVNPVQKFCSEAKVQDGNVIYKIMRFKRFHRMDKRLHRLNRSPESVQALGPDQRLPSHSLIAPRTM